MTWSLFEMAWSLFKMAWSFLDNDLVTFQNDQAISSFLGYGLAAYRQRIWTRTAEIFKIFAPPGAGVIAIRDF